jgi:uncharacterized protein (TIGR02246 family)
MKRLTTKLAALVVVLLATAPGWAEQPKANSDDEQAIRDLQQAASAAFAKGDAKAMAARYAPEGDRLGADGQMTKGRAALEKGYANLLAQNKGAALRISPDSLRFITSDVAITDGTVELTPAPESGPSKMHATVVYVKRDGKWLITALRLMVPYQQAKQ